MRAFRPSGNPSSRAVMPTAARLPPLITRGAGPFPEESAHPQRVAHHQRCDTPGGISLKVRNALMMPKPAPDAIPAPRPKRLGSIANVTEPTDADVSLRVLVYSHDAATRSRVMSALGTRPHPDLPRLDHLEVATAAVVIENMDAGGIDLAILDGEAAPTGGMGLAKQLRDELDHCPPILVLIGRADDRWLADWSRADASVPHPIDPLTLRDAVNDLLTRARTTD